MEHTPTPASFTALRLALAEARLALARVTADRDILLAATAGVLGAPAQPGPRWHGEAH